MLLTVLLLALETVHSGAVNGVVRDAKTGEPLAYANVELQGTGLGTVTNASGYYYLGGVDPGSYQLIISYIGFQTLRQPVSVREGQVSTVNAELIPEPVKLGEVKVTAARAR
ncbi:MAG: carboxypeptidase-like regulatory domain-containing protein, partial [candidate division WOR-3 bacterium]